MREREGETRGKEGVSERDERKRTTTDAREGTQRRVEAIDYRLKTRDRTGNDYDFRSISRGFLAPSPIQFRRNTRIEVSVHRERRAHAECQKVRQRGRERRAGRTCVSVHAAKGVRKGGRERA